MADITLTAMPTLGGADITLGENRILERGDLALVSIATPLGGDAALAAAITSGWGLDMPGATQSTSKDGVTLVRTSPDQVLMVFPHQGTDANETVQGKLNGAGYTTLQTDAWVILDLSGPDTLAALERLCPLDLATFKTGETGRTVMEHMSGIACCIDANHFRLMSASSSAGSFLHAVETSYRYVS